MVWGQTSDFVGGEKIAMFDMDGNLINTKSGKTHAQRASDWMWFDDSVPAKLKEYASNNYVIVIASNQKGVSTGATKLHDLFDKVMDFSTQFDFPLAVMLATHEDIFRKPCIGMWEYYRDNLNDGLEISLADSFYVGDAAGREKGNGREKKDHGHGDRCFAANIGIRFYTPEMFFLGEKEVLPEMPKSILQIFGNRTSIFLGEEYEINPANKHGNFLF